MKRLITKIDDRTTVTVLILAIVFLFLSCGDNPASIEAEPVVIEPKPALPVGFFPEDDIIYIEVTKERMKTISDAMNEGAGSDPYYGFFRIDDETVVVLKRVD